MARALAATDDILSTRRLPARCDTATRQAVLRESVALGVPRDYGHRRGLKIVREPRDLVDIGDDIHARAAWLAPRAAAALARMIAAAARDTIALQPVSAFRSARYQLELIGRKLARGITIEAILEVNAAPGYSEHHSGRAVDLTTPGYAPLEEIFERSPAFAWLRDHAARFGFVLSYPRENPHGIAYEPWHWCWHARRQRA